MEDAMVGTLDLGPEPGPLGGAAVKLGCREEAPLKFTPCPLGPAPLEVPCRVALMLLRCLSVRRCRSFADAGPLGGAALAGDGPVGVPDGSPARPGPRGPDGADAVGEPAALRGPLGATLVLIGGGT